MDQIRPASKPAVFAPRISDMSRPKATANPVEHTYSNVSPPDLPSETHHIAGITCSVFGLSELPSDIIDVACLWLLHPRLQAKECMVPFAAHIINDWNSRLQSGSTRTKKGLIAVSFDQRNHGAREVSKIANEAWRGGNPKHAQDMFSVYHGTAMDTSLLIDYLSAYIFPDNRHSITEHMVLGISLGGHAAWHCLMQDSRISAAIVTIGCPDYTRMMSDRARLSKLKTYTGTKPPGVGFVGSIDFPHGLVDAVRRYDPAALLWGSLRSHGARQGQEHLHAVTAEDKVELVPLMARTLGNKRILNLSGASDRLVPYACGKPFLDWLKQAVGKGGFFEGGGTHLEDIVVDGVGHEVPPEMVTEMVRFVGETLEGENVMTAGKRGSRVSRM